VCLLDVASVWKLKETLSSNFFIYGKNQLQLLAVMHLIKKTVSLSLNKQNVTESVILNTTYRGADKSLARPTSLSIVFSVWKTGGSPMGPDPENRVGDQDNGSPGRPVSSWLRVLNEPFPSWSG
jgi:hypothetical protein